MDTFVQITNPGTIVSVGFYVLPYATKRSALVLMDASLIPLLRVIVCAFTDHASKHLIALPAGRVMGTSVAKVARCQRLTNQSAYGISTPEQRCIVNRTEKSGTGLHRTR